MQSTPARQGFLAAFAAFAIWGFSPLYWKLLADVGALEAVSHRVIWSLLMLTIVMALGGGFGVLRRLRTERRLVLILATTTTLTAINWLLFVWAIFRGRVLEASLGYFIAPLLNVLLGRLFLGERLRPWQRTAVLLATAGVAWRMLHLGAFPWIPLSLALTFSIYGLIRKQAPVGALDGLFVETLFAAPFAMAWIAWLTWQGSNHMGTPARLLPLIGTGLLTALPLLMFAYGARRLSLATLGFAQYISPSLEFILAVFVFRESFDYIALTGFVCIWIALAIFSLDAMRAPRPL